LLQASIQTESFTNAGQARIQTNIPLNERVQIRVKNNLLKSRIKKKERQTKEVVWT